MSYQERNSYRENGSQSGRRSGGNYSGNNNRSNSGSRRGSNGRGWFGDSQAHAEAAERGWEHRQGGSYSGRGGYNEHDYDYSNRSNRGGNYSSSDNGRGWEHRQEDSRYDRGNYNNGNRYNDYDDDDYGYNSRGSNRNNSDDNSRGWFGDSQGHAEAAERGWEHRHGGSGSNRGNYNSRNRYNDYDDDYSSRGGRR